MNAGQQLLTDAINNGFDNMATVLFAGACIVVLLGLRMVKVSLDNAGIRGRARTTRRMRR